MDTKTGTFVQDFWREKRTLHINYKELEAAVATVKSLARPGETVNLCVDNTVAFSYLKKWGGRIPSLNKILKPLFLWCKAKDITVKVEWVPSQEMQADGISRWGKDKGDYTLHKNIFLLAQRHFSPHIHPEVDMFASPGNTKLPLFCSRWPHFQAHKVDALNCPLQDLTQVYANPPGPSYRIGFTG